MADDEYNKKLESLQQYIPFLNNMIIQLKDPRKKNREQQLAKMVSLHSMITDKKKKLKLDTLMKCEDVILKLYEKVKSGSSGSAHLHLSKPTTSTSGKYSPITPSSPSPPRDLPRSKPVVIPTEKVVDRSDSMFCPPSAFKNKIDIYSSAADSLKTISPSKPSVFDRLGAKTKMDMSKPPISLEDLEALQEEDPNVDTEKMSLNELTDLRAKLQKQLSKSVDNANKSRTVPINTTVRNTTILTKKIVDKTASESNKKPEAKPFKMVIPSSVKPVKVIKEAASIFGSALSSIDNKILEDATKKEKEKERRNSVGSKKEGEFGEKIKELVEKNKESVEKTKERRSSKDDKKSESSSHKSSKDKTDRKSSERKSKEGDKKLTSEHKNKDSEKKSNSEHKSKDGDKKIGSEHKSKDQNKERDKDKEERKNRDANKNYDKKEEKEKSTDKNKEEDVSEKKELPKEKPKEEVSKPIETPPVYKRLADKYNPKPRKISVENTPVQEIPKVLEVPKSNIPFLESKQNLTQISPIKSIFSSIPLNIPLLSPTSSTTSMDNEVANLNRKPGFPPLMPHSAMPQTPQPVPSPINNLQQFPNQVHNMLGMSNHPNSVQPISNQLNSILGNPNTTAIINTVVNQFKVNQGPLMMNSAQNFNSLNIPNNQNNYSNNNFQQNDVGNQYNNPMPHSGSVVSQQSNMNYWPNQQQPHVQNFVQRSFTPVPHQFDQIQQQPQRSFTPLPHQYDQMQQQKQHQQQQLPYYSQGQQNLNNYNPPLLPTPTDNFQGRPQVQSSNDSDILFGAKDRDMRASSSTRDWRRWSRDTSREPPHDSSRDRSHESRDPRIHRDPRSYRDDSRSYRRDSRDSRESERDSRSRYRDRDPRLNRYSSSSRYDRDSSYRRSRSTSRDSDETNTFMSPLDSLYSGNDGYRKTGKGYGVQTFKIPKLKKEDEVDVDKDKPREKKDETTDESTSSLRDDSQSPVQGQSDEKPKVQDNEENTASTSVSSSTELDVNETKTVKESEPESAKASAEVAEISSTNEIQDTETADDVKIGDQTDIINKFLKRLLENESTRAAAALFIDNVSNSLDDEKLKMVVQTVKSATVLEEAQEKRRLLSKKRGKFGVRLTRKKQMVKRKLKVRPKPKPRSRVIRDEDDDDENEPENKDEESEEEKKEDKEEEPEEEKQEELEEAKEEVAEEEDQDEVLVTVGERIKSRKRVANANKTKRKKARPHKTELDLLHEDIQDMFIRDGVLTATGKRMCRLLKNDADKDQAPTSPRTPKTRSRRLKAAAAAKFNKADKDKLKVMSNVRVLLPKISVDKMAEGEDESQRYSLRRANKANKSYAEPDSDDEKDRDRKAKEKGKEKLKEIISNETKMEQEAKKEEKEPEKEIEEETENEKEKIVSTPKRIIHRKRSKAWASGVIPKKRQKRAAVENEPEPEPEADKALDFIEPDKTYYSAKTSIFKSACKLCDFSGKNISGHYRVSHPESEVLCSRLSPEKAEEAVKESTELKLDETEEIVLVGRGLYTFKCRFCDVVIKTKVSNFYDHISTHTGEFRHACSLCHFGVCNVKTLKNHYLKVHGQAREDKSKIIKTKVYGYICLDCNFVQIDRKTVENHVNIYHLGEGKKIMKIYLSSTDHLIKDKKDKIESAEISSVDTKTSSPESEVKKPGPRSKKKKQKEEEEPPVLQKQIEEDEDDVPIIKRKKLNEKEKRAIEGKEESPLMDKVKTSEKELPKGTETIGESSKTEESPMEEQAAVEPQVEKEPEIPKEPVIKKEKEIDMTVFTCATNIQEENQKIEEERLKTMTELHETVKKTSRQTLSFVEQLSNRLLLEEEKQDEPQEETSKAAPEMVLVKDEPLDIEPEPEMVMEADGLFEFTPKKQQKLIEKPASSSVEVQQKDNVKIQGMIQKLRGILQDENTMETEGPPPLTPLEKLSEDDTILSAGFLNIVKSSDGLEYACRVPSCLFSTKDRDTFVSHWDEDHLRVNQTCKGTKCRICSSEIKASYDASLLSNFFTHVEREHLESTKRTILKTRRLSGDKLSVPKDDSNEGKPQDIEDKPEDNPFPFKISGVMSLAEDPVPPLSPIKEKPSGQSKKLESVILKEAKLSNIDKKTLWKCDEAMKKFLQCPRDLYKCPQFFCKYCTNWRHSFETHTKAHAAFNDELVSCVYCEIKTPLSHAGLHIDLRHSNCLYSCSLCLYRALTREYVMIHMKLKHKEGDLIISLPPKTSKTIMMSSQKKYSVRDTCQPYVCGYKGCEAQFLFQSEYHSHSVKHHDGIMICGFKTPKGPCIYKCLMAENMVDHWRGHYCYHFHCLLCKVGCMELYSMLEHYSLTHPSMEPMVVDRRSSPSTDKVYGYSEDAFSAIKFLNEELLESVSSKKCKIVEDVPQISPKPPTEPPKSLAFVPLSILQGTNNEKKLYAIIPKSMDGLTSKPVQLFTTVTKDKPQAIFKVIPTKDLVKSGLVEEPVAEVEETTVEDVVEPINDVTAVDPLSLDSEITNTVVASGDESDSQDVSEVIDMKKFGLIGYQLYRCAFCDISFSNAKDFKAHSMHSKQCRDDGNSQRQLKCVHCERLFKNPHGLLEHIQYHGQLRFGCSLCPKKFPSSFSLKLHMRSKHNVTQTVSTPVLPNKTNVDSDEFVLRPVPVEEPDIKESSSSQSSPNHKNVFSPNEIDKLPQRYIFNSDVRCALCSYSTKVRTNLVRHLQFHSTEKAVPDIAPVNPVPCLDKNEKMFDKMTNLAISSFTGGGRMGGVVKTEMKAEKEKFEVPAYVPPHRRFACCATGCKYLCLEESNLRHHLLALHVQEPSFTCVHCKTVLKPDIEVFFKHLKLHDLHLYKCPNCLFVHNLRHKVDKHSADQHPDNIESTITIRALEAEPTDADQSQVASTSASIIEPPPPTNIKWTKPWHCGMCKYRCAAKNDIMTHIFNKHDINTQYKCTHCSYKTNEKQTFEEHFKLTHPDSDVDFIHVYYKSEGVSLAAGTTQKLFDTTPLWQRDRPRVRHIRGILFEETSPQKNVKKSYVAKITSTPPSTSNTSNLDLAIEAVARGVDQAALASTSRNSPELIQVDTNTIKETIFHESVIIIDDDDDEIEEQLPLDESGELMIDVEGGHDGHFKLEPEDSELQSEDILLKKYGEMCASVGRAFKCPICLKFRTKKISYLIYHLLVEMKCKRFKCNSCDYGCVSFDIMVSHCQEEHNSELASNVTDISVPKGLLYWLQMVIRHQTRTILKLNPVSMGEEYPSPANKFQCDYCKRWFRNIHVMKEHELYHWSEHTYTCGHCCSEQPSLNTIFQHNFTVHPKYECDITINGPSVEKVITTLKHHPVPAGSPITNASSEDMLYSCTECSVTEKSVGDLRKHCMEVHKTDVEDVKFKAVTKAKLEVMYSCTYCHERSTDKELKIHHDDKHKNLKFSIYQYICLECSGTFLNIKDLRAHHTKVHIGKKMHYSCVENKQSGSIDQYICTKCPFRSCSAGGIRSHLKKHLRPVDCTICGATFIYPTEARAHHNKEHFHNAEAVVESKERLKEYEDLMQEIVKDRDRRLKGIPAPPVRKMMARKSTGAPFVRDNSHHGSKVEQTASVTATAE